MAFRIDGWGSDKYPKNTTKKVPVNNNPERIAFQAFIDGDRHAPYYIDVSDIPWFVKGAASMNQKIIFVPNEADPIEVTDFDSLTVRFKK